jgi:3-oxoacyl-[acyl-carrier-protein] synthase-1
MDDAVVIVSAGVTSPIGLSLAETAAAARGRLARLHQIEWRDQRFEPFVVATVPDDGLPPLHEDLVRARLQYREARMLRMAHAALEEALETLPSDRKFPLLLGLPEQHTTRPLVAADFLQRLIVQSGAPIDLARSVAAPRGRAAGLMACKQARERLIRGEDEFVIVGGVDCLVDLFVLGTLDRQQRIRTDVNSDGFSPAEGAAFLVLCTAKTAAAHGLGAFAEVLASGFAQERGHLYSDEPYLGEGLAAALSSVLSATPPPAPIGCVYSSLNGERYWGREYGVARMRNSEWFVPDEQMEHPAECCGDLGAAHGPMLAALAAHAVRDGYRRAPCLVYASSDYGDRAVTLLGKIQ